MSTDVAVTRKKRRKAGAVSSDMLVTPSRATARKQTNQRPAQRASGFGDRDGGSTVLFDPSGGTARDAILPFAEIRPRVLLVDDDSGVFRALRVTMEGYGIDLFPATRDRHAWECLSTSSFDVAIVDWVLPGSECDGLDLLVQIRGEYSELPILFLTGYGTAEVEREAYARGADAYLRKAKFGPKDLRRVILELVQTARARGVWVALDRVLKIHNGDFSRLGKHARKAIGEMCVMLGQDLSVESLARAAGCKSSDYFAHVFRRAVGLAPKAFLKHLRVERAKLLLRDTDLTHKAIAERVGFGSPDNMREAFKKVEGRAPSDFRDKD